MYLNLTTDDIHSIALVYMSLRDNNSTIPIEIRPLLIKLVSFYSAYHLVCGQVSVFNMLIDQLTYGYNNIASLTNYQLLKLIPFRKPVENCRIPFYSPLLLFLSFFIFTQKKP